MVEVRRNRSPKKEKRLNNQKILDYLSAFGARDRTRTDTSRNAST